MGCGCKKKKTSKKKNVITPFKVLQSGVLGKANRDGTIEVAPGLSPEKRKEVVDNIQRKEDVNKEKQLESGRTFVYAADQALQKDPAPSPQSQVAKQMTTRGVTALGPPQMENAMKSDQMVNGLLSTDPEQVKAGQAILATMDKNLVALQNQNRILWAYSLKLIFFE